MLLVQEPQKLELLVLDFDLSRPGKVLELRRY